MAVANEVVTPAGGPRLDLAFGGRYLLIERLGRGASSEVFLAEDLTRADRCAVKIYASVDGPATSMLLGEFTRLAELAHRGIVAVRDLGRAREAPFAGRPYVVTDHVSGPSVVALATVPDSGERLRAFARVAQDLADAVAYLHGRGVLHGDIAPGNVRLAGGERAVLIDFGLARPWWAAAGDGATGTPGYMAPEALIGQRGPASDLFSLGATLYAAWTGAAPFGEGVEAIRRMREGPPPLPSSVRAGLPEAWEALIMSLVAFAPEARPASAREVLRRTRQLAPEVEPAAALGLGAPYPAGDPLAGVFVGREPQRAALLGALEALAEGSASTSVVAVVGPPGAGRRALIRRVLQDLRIAVVSGELPDFDIEESRAEALLTPAEVAVTAREEPARAAASRLAAAAASLERRAAARPLCLVLPPGPDAEALATAVGGGESSGRLVVVLPTEPPVKGSSLAVSLPPLGEQELGVLAARALGETPAPDVARALARVSGGHAATAAVLLRRWAAAARDGRDQPFRLDPADADLGRLLDEGLAALPGRARFLVVAQAFSSPSSPAAVLAGLDAATAEGAALEAAAAGWLLVEGKALSLPTDAHAEACMRALAAGQYTSVARAAASSLPPDDPRRGEALAALGDPAEAAACFRAAAARAQAAGRIAAAARAWERALALDPARCTVDDRCDLAGALGVLGRYDEALGLLPAPALDAPSSALVAERRAWILGRRGDLAGARAVLEGALEAAPGVTQTRLRARLAKVLVSLGRPEEAFEAVHPATVAAESPGSSALFSPRASPEGRGEGAPLDGAADGRAVAPDPDALEAAVLALIYGGRPRDAGPMLDRLRALPAPPAAQAARIQALIGLWHQSAGQPLEATGAYRAATALHESIDDLHGRAAATFNLGCVLAETGAYGDALDAFARSIADLGHLRATSDLSLALFNAGLLLVQLGDLDGAGRAVRRLRDEASAAGLSHFEAYASCLEADLNRRRRAPALAAAGYGAAAQALSSAGNTHLAAFAALGRAEALAEAGQVDAALAAWRAIEGASLALQEPLALARARIALASVPEATDLALADQLAAIAAGAATASRRPVAWRAASLAAGLLGRHQHPRAAALKERARHQFEEVKMLTPARYRPALAADPEAPLPVAAPGDGQAVRLLVERAARAEGRLRRFVRMAKRLNSEQRLSRVLETLVDTVIELTDAERGFLLLKDNDGELVVKVARNIDQKTLEGADFALSRSIARQAAETGQPVITVDASGDDRFRAAMSVSNLHLRSVLAVPLTVKGNVVGTIYVDHRLRRGVFDEDDVALVLDFAEQGAIAIDNARLLAELRRRERQVESLNQRLERELRARRAELTEVREELKESREAAALRYDYRQIVGRTPRMMELFRLLDRVTDTTLPAVIQGESGTGKELVARAIHFNGPRRERPFVSENCAAIPETLLESTLFGYVKGAFTGADRDTRGLFAIADGGTLFLDEVAEMSPAMQGKLLRVLQDGEMRRVGSERSQKVDVRIVVATNRDLGRLVEEGKFRRDLFFRLSVVRIQLPPLRERREDIPSLVDHFLRRSAGAGGTPKGIEPAALAKLVAHRWPGNVRELENEVTRAAAFADSRITVADLSAHIAAGEDGPIDDGPEARRLKFRVERLERSLIREVLAECEGNQTKAAEVLGLSRFGLQKKLRRYGISP